MFLIRLFSGMRTLPRIKNVCRLPCTETGITDLIQWRRTAAPAETPVGNRVGRPAPSGGRGRAGRGVGVGARGVWRGGGGCIIATPPPLILAMSVY